MARGFAYLVAIMDWSSRKVLAWRLSNTMDVSFCVEALEEALDRHGPPEIFNTDQGSQFTSWAWTQRLKAAGSEVTEIVDHEQMKSVYFTDNNGIALEASYWVIDGTGRPMDVNDERVFTDPDPVPAVAELADGAIGSMPTTRLV